MAEQVEAANQPTEQYESPFKNIRYDENPYFPGDNAVESAAQTEEAPQGAEPEEATQESAPEAEGEVGTFVPEGEDFDPNSPEYKHFQSAYTRKRKKEVEELKKLKADYEARLAALEAAPKQETSSQETPEATPDPSDPYTVSFDDFTPQVTIPEDSELSGLEAPLASFVKDITSQAITHVLGQIKQKNEVFEQRTRAMTAREKVDAYINEAMLHPEYESKVGAIAAMAQQPAIQRLAVEDPDTFITLVEAKTGIKRGWSGEDEATAAPHAKPQRPAPINKARAATPRGTTRAINTAPVKDGYYDLDDAIDKALAG